MAVDLRLPLGVVRLISAHAPTEEPGDKDYTDFLRHLLALKSGPAHLLIGLDGNCRLSCRDAAPLVGPHGE
eukprot:6778742-Prorocentrum_lima.AAC.1